MQIITLKYFKGQIAIYKYVEITIWKISITNYF